MTGLSIALIVWASSLVASKYWIGGLVFFIIAACIISIEIWLLVVLITARRDHERLSLEHKTQMDLSES
jgi:hypothetical protein